MIKTQILQTKDGIIEVCDNERDWLDAEGLLLDMDNYPQAPPIYDVDSAQAERNINAFFRCTVYNRIEEILSGVNRPTVISTPRVVNSPGWIRRFWRWLF